MKLRYAIVDDAPLISHIHAASWKYAYRDLVPRSYLDDLADDFWGGAFSQWLEDSLVKVQMALAGGIPAGCIAYGNARDEALPHWGEIVSIYLLPEYMGDGYGYALLQAALEDLKSAGHLGVYLWVLEENTRARQFYEQQGFSPNGDKTTVTILGKQLVELRYVRQLHSDRN